MKRILLAIGALFVFQATFSQQMNNRRETLVPVYPGEPGKRAFWNKYAARFIYAPAFDFAELPGANEYQFTIVTASGKTIKFKTGKPWAPLSPVWESIPEGITTVTVDGLSKAGAIIGKAGERKFYRSPAFSQAEIKPADIYFESARQGLQALFKAPSVQYWLQHGKPDPVYARYCFANKVIGGLLKAMVAYSQNAMLPSDQSDAKEMARKMGDYLLSIRQPHTSRYAHVPPTYIENVDKPPAPAPDRARKNWLMVPSVVDASLGLLDLYDITNDKKYYEAVIKMAHTLLVNQDADGTWPIMVNAVTGEPVHSLRMIPTSIINFFDRLDHQYLETAFREGRKKAWDWVVKNPLRTYQWDAQFEDVQLKGPYENMAREQACNAASLLLENANNNPQVIAQAEELLRFAEDQFVVWSSVKDPEGWTSFVHPVRKRAPETWFSPTVLEQFICYEPVARSSAILINVYIKAHQVTRKKIYLEKASGIANGLLAGQEYISRTYGGPSEIPTWVKKMKPSNWMNNSYYAAEAVMNLALYLKKKVLIIGDSISIGYFPIVKDALSNNAEVVHNPGNSQHTGTGLRLLDEWLGNTKWDVIHFNWGLWDLCYRNPQSKDAGKRDKVNGKLTFPVKQYAINLDSLVFRLKATGAKLIFATTTFVPANEPGRFEGDEKIYNKAALQVMKKYNVIINDLHTVSKKVHQEHAAGVNDVHYTQKGYELLAKSVIEIIRKEL